MRKNSRLLMYGLLGLGAYYLLKRGGALGVLPPGHPPIPPHPPVHYPPPRPWVTYAQPPIVLNAPQEFIRVPEEFRDPDLFGADDDPVKRRRALIKLKRKRAKLDKMIRLIESD
jgi:hypothetical protein